MTEKRVWLKLKYCPHICLEGLRRNVKGLSWNGWYPGQNLKWVPLEYTQTLLYTCFLCQLGPFLIWFNAPWLVYLYLFKFSFLYECHNDTPIGGTEKLTWKWIITAIILVVVICMICEYWSDCVTANFKICHKAFVRATEWKVYHPWQASCLWTRLQQKTEAMTTQPPI